MAYGRRKYCAYSYEIDSKDPVKIDNFSSL
jgi:hypothetical protein